MLCWTLTIEQDCTELRRGAPAEELQRLLEAEGENAEGLDPHLEAFMKAQTLEGKREAIATEYILRVLGLDVCSHSFPFNSMGVHL